jgi:sensor histidine kinase YesM
MPPVKKNIVAIVLPIFIVLLAAHTLLFYKYAASDISTALLSGLLVTTTQSAAAWGLFIIISSYPTRVGIIPYAIFLATIFAAVVYFADTSFLKWFGSDEPGYVEFISWSGLIHFIVSWVVCNWVATAAAWSKQIIELKKAMTYQTDASILVREAELYKLRQQLQPHFLYNSLNSISALTMMAPEKAQEMIGRLSDFLRSSVRREAQEYIPVNDELAYIESYLAIEAIRFGDRLKVVFEKNYTDDAQIPPFLLQPVLENAIKFGLYGKTGEVTISAHISLIEDTLIIKITNPYDPQTAAPKGTGFGLEGIRRRLYLLYARKDLLETSQNENLFTTTLKIPQHV